MTIHPRAESFGAVADDYDRRRPTYPFDATSWLFDCTGIAEGTPVLDLAAGTGKFTRCLVERGAHVIAVEPVEGMRRRLEADMPGVRALYGTAESIPLPDGAVHAVTVAQAFHWFDHAKALPEIHRALAPGGRLAVIFNVRHPVDALEVALERLWGRYRQDVPTHRDGAWHEALVRSELFGPLRHRVFEIDQVLDAGGLVARVTSTSFVASLPASELLAVADELRGLCERYGTPARLHYRTDCYWTERRDRVAPSSQKRP